MNTSYYQYYHLLAGLALTPQREWRRQHRTSVPQAAPHAALQARGTFQSPVALRVPTGTVPEGSAGKAQSRKCWVLRRETWVLASPRPLNFTGTQDGLLCPPQERLRRSSKYAKCC